MSEPHRPDDLLTEQASAGAIGIMVESRIADLDAKGVLQDSLPMFNPSSIFTKVVLITPYKSDLALSQRLEQFGFEIAFHGGRLGRPWTLPLAVIRLCRIVRQFDIALLRASNIYIASILAALVGWLCGIPTTAWVGGDNRLAQELNQRYYFRYRRLTNAIERIGANAVGTVVVANDFTRQYVLGLGIAGRTPQTKVVPWRSRRISGTSDPLRAGELASLDGTTIVAVIGFINKYKYSDVLFRMLAAGPITVGGRQATFIFCGDGDLADEGRHIFSHRPDVQILGFRPPEFVDELLRRANVVCVPMSGLVLLESASLGKPVVAGNIEWHPEVIKDGVTGLLVDPRDPVSWRNSLVQLLSDPAFASRLGANLQSSFEERYSPEASEERLSSVFREALALR